MFLYSDGMRSFPLLLKVLFLVLVMQQPKISAVRFKYTGHRQRLSPLLHERLGGCKPPQRAVCIVTIIIRVSCPWDGMKEKSNFSSAFDIIM